MHSLQTFSRRNIIYKVFGGFVCAGARAYSVFTFIRLMLSTSGVWLWLQEEGQKWYVCVLYACLWEYFSANKQRFLPADRPNANMYSPRHAHTLTHMCTYGTYMYAHTHASFILKPSLTYQSAYHVNSCDMVRLGGWFIFSKSSSHSTTETLKVQDRNSIKKIMK